MCAVNDVHLQRILFIAPQMNHSQMNESASAQTVRVKFIDWHAPAEIRAMQSRTGAGARADETEIAQQKETDLLCTDWDAKNSRAHTRTRT